MERADRAIGRSAALADKDRPKSTDTAAAEQNSDLRMVGSPLFPRAQYPSFEAGNGRNLSGEKDALRAL